MEAGLKSPFFFIVDVAEDAFPVSFGSCLVFVLVLSAKTETRFDCDTSLVGVAR